MSFQNYDHARRTAQINADASGLDHAIESLRPGSWIVRPLPCVKNRYGVDLRCEVVHPNCEARPGHGPGAGPVPNGWIEVRGKKARR